MSVIEVNSDDHFTELTSDVSPEKLIALYFYTPWAAPCIQINTVYQQLAQQNPEVSFLSINADEHPDISELFEVSAVPYFVLIKNDTILKEISGADPKEFVQALEELQGGASAGQSQQQTSQQSPLAQTQAQIPATTSSQPAVEAQEEESPEALNARLKQLTEASPVMLFMKGTPASPQCGFSRQLVAILRENQVRFGFFDILKDDSVRQGLKTFSDWPTFPQLYINGEFQGGLDIIKENLEEDPNFFQNAINA